MKILIKIIDYITFSIIAFSYAILILLLYLKPVNPKINNLSEKSIICLNPICWEDIVKKGIVDHVYQLNQDSYFKIFYLIHFFCLEKKEISLINNTTILEYKKNKFIRIAKLRFTSYLLTEISTMNELNHLIKQKRINIIKSQEPYLNGIRALILKKLNGVPYIQDLRCDYDLSFKSTGKPTYPKLRFRKIEKILERIVFKNADIVFGGNDHLTEYAIRNGANKNRTFTIRDIGVGEKHFLPLKDRKNIKEELGLLSNRSILYCGRLNQEKYVEDVIRAFDIISKELPGSVLLLAGDGEQRTYLEELIKSLNLKNVMFLGFKSQDYIFNLMYSVDVIASPLTGSSLVEAALSSTPIVAYDVEWHSELIKDGETGRLVKFRNYDEMANAIIEIISNPRLNYGENARKLAIEMFSPEKTLEQRKMIIEKLFNGELNEKIS